MTKVESIDGEIGQIEKQIGKDKKLFKVNRLIAGGRGGESFLIISGLGCHPGQIWYPLEMLLTFGPIYLLV